MSNRRLILLFIAVTSSLFARSAGAPQGVSGAPGDGVCTQCHTSNPLNSGTGKITVTFANGTTYTPGQTQRITIMIEDAVARRWGFEASPRPASAPMTPAGELTSPNENAQILGTAGSVQWATHTSAGTRNGTTGGVSFQVDWKAPATDVGPVDLYVAANAANGTGNNQGDFIYTTKATVTAATSTPQRPAISSGGVVSAAHPQAGVVAGSWISIYGQNLSSTTRSWRSDEFVNGALPTTVDGVSMTVNGKPAAISFVSPGQVNAQAPDDTATGPVNVVVKTAGGESTPLPVTLQQFSPALFLFSPQNNKYVAAVAPDGANLGPAGLFGSGVTTRPARPGETILLFGTGFGPTNPAVAAGRLFSGAAPLTNPVTITIGGVQATVSFAGLSSVGLYQFNVAVPATLPSGDQPVIATIGGVQSPAGATLAVSQ